MNGLVFVHGISNGREVREKLHGWFRFYLERNGIKLAMTGPAIWRSSGRFDYDLDILYRVDGLREDAIDDVATAIWAHSVNMRDFGDPDEPRNLVVVGHSMGQVLAYLAIHRLQEQKKLLVPTKLLTLGGPMGNTNPIYKSYLAFARKGPPRHPDGTPMEWNDVWNPDDPICSNVVEPGNLLKLLPKLPGSQLAGILNSAFSFSFGAAAPYQAPPGATGYRMDHPGRPDWSENPMKEHGSYFENKMPFDILKKMLGM